MRILAIPIVILIALTLPISTQRGVSRNGVPSTEERSKLPTPGPSPGLQGYCWPLSAKAPERITFYVSGSGSSTVRFFRHTADESGVVSTRMRGTTTFTPREQRTRDKASQDGAGWEPSFTKIIPDYWRSGIYSAELTDLRGTKSYITFIVKPRTIRMASPKVAVIANVNTWLAYNDWGGRSKYSGAAHLSFMRPNPGASPLASIQPYGHLTRGELWVLGWLEAEGYEPDVYTDIDLHNGTILRGYKYLVLSTHPEYWTEGMYDGLNTILNDGVSLLYLGGNGIYEKADYEFSSTNNGMSFRNGVEGRREVALWRVLRRPERRILGVGLERCGVQGAPYQVLEACHPLFRGTTLRNGDLIGEVGLNTGCGLDCGIEKGDRNGGAAAGWEIDTSNGIGARGFPTGCIECTPGRDCPRFLTPRSGPELPPNLIVLARAQNWREGGAWKGAEIVYYDHPGGGFVLSVGSIQFGGSLAIDRDLQQILRNAFTPSPARITKAVELGDRRESVPWSPLTPRSSLETSDGITLTGLSFDAACETDWYKVIAFPRPLPDPPRDGCIFELSISFSSGVRLTRVEERPVGSGIYLDLETRTSPFVIRGMSFNFEQLVFRAEAEGRTRGPYELTFEFSGPVFCRR